MNKILFTYLLLLVHFLLFIGCSHPVISENNIEDNNVEDKEIIYNRHKYQIYLQDSVDVFWTQYPDPFSNPACKDRYVVSQAYTFKCFLNGVLEIGFIDSITDSIIYKFKQPQISEKLKYNDYFWIWHAYSYSDTANFPAEYFRSLSLNPVNLALMVDDSIKTILPIQHVVPVNEYCFINWTNHFK